MIFQLIGIHSLKPVTFKGAQVVKIVYAFPVEAIKKFNTLQTATLNEDNEN